MGLKYTIWLDCVGDYAVGDPRPEGYMAFHEWAKVQYRGGLRQLRCPGCGKWRFPQEKCCEAPRPE